MANSSPVLSVVMPVFNQERYVVSAIDSILKQTFTDFELIVVDDGSTDGTADALSAVSDPRFRYLIEPHAGFIQALLRGYEAARGEWIARMDSDDVCHPDRLRLQMEFLRGHPECLFVGTAYGFISPHGRLVAPREQFDWRYVEPEQITLGGRVFGDPSTVFNKNAAEEFGYYDPDFENENPLWYRLLASGKGGVLGRVLYYNRWRMGSVSLSNFEANHRMHVAVRQRYDAGNAIHLRKRDVSEKAATLSKGEVGIDLFQTAGDHAAARALALSLWRRWPFDASATGLFARALLGIDRFRLWKKRTTPSLLRVDPAVLQP